MRFKLGFVGMVEISIVGTGVLDCPKKMERVITDRPEACPYNLKPKIIHTRQEISRHLIVGQGLAPAVTNRFFLSFGGSKPRPTLIIQTDR